jgi:outer membrane lipoprotein LolB
MSKRSLRRHALFAVLSAALSGCASLNSPIPAAGPVQTARAFHAAIDLGGRLSVRYRNGDREEALHGNFSWSQTPVRTTVTLLSPLGQTMAVINVTPEGATLAQSGQPLRGAADVDDLTADTLGWPLPVAGLRDWLQGFALDAAGQRFVATPAASEVTTADGWRLRYPGWDNDTAAYRPRRIDLARATEQAGDVSIRIVIDTWQTH